MGLNLIPNDISNLTSGEKRVANKLKSIYSCSDDECYLYVQPRIKHLNPDFILIDPYKGICVIEVKDWSRDYIAEFNNTNILDVTGKKLDNPVFKTNTYLNITKNIFQSRQLFYDEQGNFELFICSRVIFPNMRSIELEEFNHQLYQPPAKCISSEQLRKLSFNILFSEDTRFLDENLVSTIRGMLFPEIKVKSVQTKVWTFSRTNRSKNSIIDTLDGEQEKFARQIPYGHYMVTGVPGSGKTVILLSRAIHLIKEKPNWKIRILTYNKLLASRLKNRFESLYEDLELMGVNYQNITISTFHSLAMEFSSAPPVHKSDDYWKHQLPYNAIQNAVPTYDAILIDEYQDFYDIWIKLCLLLCKKHEYNNVETENIFLAGDRLQSIYNSKEHSWKSLGINIVGRSKLLKTSYRSGSNHINLALDYLMDDEKHKKEVERFYEGRDGVCCTYDVDNFVDFIKGDIATVNEYLKVLFTNENYNPDDVLVLVPTANGRDVIYRRLEEGVKLLSFSGKEIKINKMDITTYHSSKGLECKVCILLNVDSVIDKKVLYVGMTRASEKLCIHSFSPEIGEVFNKLMSYYAEMKTPVESKTLGFDNIKKSIEEDKSFLVKDIRKKHPNAYSSWSKEEDFKLVNLYKSGKSIDEISESLGRKKGGIKSRLKKLGVFFNEVGYKKSKSIPVDVVSNPIDKKKEYTPSPSKKESKSVSDIPVITSGGSRNSLKNKFRKFTSFFSVNESLIDENALEIKQRIILESNQKWVHDSLSYLEKSETYKPNESSKKTYELLKSESNIHEIANRRGLKSGMIITHLIGLAISGNEIPHSLINNEIELKNQLIIIDELKKNGFVFKKVTKDQLGKDFSYNQINLMIALLISYNKKLCA